MEAIEALSLGLPMVVMPQWTDQTMNGKLVQDVWKVGIRVKVDEKGIVGRDEFKGCLREVMEGDGGKGLKTIIGIIFRYSVWFKGSS